MKFLLLVICALALSCTCKAVNTSRGWQLIHSYSIQEIASRPLERCYETVQGLVVFNDGTVGCPDEGRMNFAADRIMDMTMAAPGALDGANVIVSKDRFDYGTKSVRGMTSGRIAFVNIEGMWQVTCHELAHVLEQKHKGPCNKILSWRIYESCSRGYRESK